MSRTERKIKEDPATQCRAFCAASCEQNAPTCPRMTKVTCSPFGLGERKRFARLRSIYVHSLETQSDAVLILHPLPATSTAIAHTTSRHTHSILVYFLLKKSCFDSQHLKNGWESIDLYQVEIYIYDDGVSVPQPIDADNPRVPDVIRLKYFFFFGFCFFFPLVLDEIGNVYYSVNARDY